MIRTLPKWEAQAQEVGGRVLLSTLREERVARELELVEEMRGRARQENDSL